MQIKNINVGGINGATPPKRQAAAARPAGDDTSFTNAAALDSALSKVPDVRPEAVERARQLIDDPSYPPLVLIQKLSRLFAVNSESSEQ